MLTKKYTGDNQVQYSDLHLDPHQHRFIFQEKYDNDGHQLDSMLHRRRRRLQTLIEQQRLTKSNYTQMIINVFFLKSSMSIRSSQITAKHQFKHVLNLYLYPLFDLATFFAGMELKELSCKLLQTEQLVQKIEQFNLLREQFWTGHMIPPTTVTATGVDAATTIIGQQTADLDDDDDDVNQSCDQRSHQKSFKVSVLLSKSYCFFFVIWVVKQFVCVLQSKSIATTTTSTFTTE